MRRGRIFLFLALILIVIVVVIVLVARQLGGSGESAQAVATPAQVDILVAAQSIPQGQPIQADALSTISLPPDKVNAVMFRIDQLDLVVGKLAQYPIEPGVPITAALIGDAPPETAGPEWMRLVTPGMVAMSVPISRLTSAAYAVQDGAHVNVIACMTIVDVDTNYQSVLPNIGIGVLGTGFAGQNALPSSTASFSEDFARQDPYYVTGNLQGRVEVEPSLQLPFYIIPQENQRPRLICQMLLQDVVVLRIGDFPLPVRDTATVIDPNQPVTAEDTATPVTTADLPPDIITLIVNPADSLALTYMLYHQAQLTLTLRNSSDTSRIAMETMTLSYLLSQYGISLPARLPYALEPRIDTLQLPYLPNDLITINQ